MKEITTQNNYEVMSIPEEQVPSILEEGEVPQSQDQTQEENKKLAESNQGSLDDGNSPKYAEMEKKRNPWITLVLPMKIALRGPKKKDANLLRNFKRKKQNV